MVLKAIHLSSHVYNYVDEYWKKYHKLVNNEKISGLKFEMITIPVFSADWYDVG